MNNKPAHHPKKRRSILMPVYAQTFECAGADCPDSCCLGWNIPIDSVSELAYESMTEGEISKSLQMNIQRKNKAGEKLTPPVFNLKAGSQECGFLEGGWCGLQKVLGEDYLSSVCYSFPRTTFEFAGQAEQVLSLGCPRAAELALTRPDAFEFALQELEYREDAISRVNAPWGLSTEHVSEIRIFCVQLMKTEVLPVWERVVILGVFCENLTTLVKEVKQGEVLGLLDDFIAMIQTGKIQDVLADITPNRQAQARFFGALWNVPHPKEPTPHQRDVLGLISRGLQGGEVDYIQGIEKLYSCLKHHPDFLERVLVNELLLDVFPFNAVSANDAFVNLVCRLGMLRFMLAGAANATESLIEKQSLIDCTQVFYRRFRHSDSYTQFVQDMLAKYCLNELDRLIPLIP